MLGPGVDTVTIVGTGLLGGSIGLALRKLGFAGQVVGAGPRIATLERAMALGCVERITTDLAEAVRGSALIVLAAPVSKIPELIARLADHVEEGAAITDVGSTKQTIVAAAERSLAHPSRFVGSHPMAGSEATGPEAAKPDLFQDKPVIVTPTRVTAPDAVERVESLWHGLGMTIHRMDPAEHDRLVAVISHVPHAAAVLLVRLASRSGALPVASTGFADVTRLAAGAPELWADIFLDNREAVLAALDRWLETGEEFRRILASSDRPALLHLLYDAQATRAAWRGREREVS